MGILSSLGKAIQVLKDDYTTPKTFKKGESFENYVREKLFIPGYYTSIERTHSYSSNKGDFVQSTLLPDFKFRDHINKREFYVEVKYRSTHYHGKYICCKDNEQFERYKGYAKECDFFLLLGIGGKPTRPDYVSLIPLCDIEEIALSTDFVRKYNIALDTPVKSSVLWKK